MSNEDSRMAFVFTGISDESKRRIRDDRRADLRSRLDPPTNINAGEVHWLLAIEEAARQVARLGVKSPIADRREAMSKMKDAIRNLSEWRRRAPEFRDELAAHDADALAEFRAVLESIEEDE